jgi:cytochrome c55X
LGWSQWDEAGERENDTRMRDRTAGITPRRCPDCQRRCSSGSEPAADLGIATAWRTLRAVNCARCHGKDYDGLVAPSIINYAKETNREMFVRKVLDGDAPRGMPGYGGNPLITENIDGIYRYFMGRADGSISSASRSQ